MIKLNDDQQKVIAKNKDIFYRSLNRGLREESIYIQSADLNEDELKLLLHKTDLEVIREL